MNSSWWYHQMETFSALLAICVGNSPVTQRPETWSFDVFFDLCLNKQLTEHSWGWWFETPLCPLWRHCNVITMYIHKYNTIDGMAWIHYPWHHLRVDSTQRWCLTSIGNPIVDITWSYLCNRDVNMTSLCWIRTLVTSQRLLIHFVFIRHHLQKICFIGGCYGPINYTK